MKKIKTATIEQTINKEQLAEILGKHFDLSYIGFQEIKITHRDFHISFIGEAVRP